MSRKTWFILGSVGAAILVCAVCLGVGALATVLNQSRQTNPEATQSGSNATPEPVVQLPTRQSTVTVQPTAGSTSAAPSSVPSGKWKLIPVAISTKKSAPGWTDYEVALAVENQGSDFARPMATVNLGNSTVETQEGFTYQLQYLNNLDYRDWPLIPPGFRVLDYAAFAFSELKLNFRAAETAHPLRIRFANYGTVDLQPVLKPTYPTDRPRSLSADCRQGFRNPRQSQDYFWETNAL